MKFPCTGYEGIVADAAGKLISDSLTYPPAVKTVTTAIKPGFSKVSASYAGNATYAPSSGTRDIRIPQAAIQIVSGTTEGNAPLVVRVSLTDPETGAVSLIALTGAVIANSSPQGAGAGASPVFVNGVATVSLNGLKAGNYIVSIEVSDVVGFGVSTNFTTPVRISPAGVTTTTSSPTTTAPATTSTPPTTIVPTTTTIASGTRIATSIVWFVLNRCSPKAPCLTYVAGVADARGNLIANELSGGVQTVETSIKPGFLKFSATYAGNAVYSPSSGTREVRIPNAAIQIVTGTVEGSGPLEVLVSLTDPETGQLTKAEVTVAIAEASPVGPGPELFASTRYIAGEDLFKFPGLKAGTYIVSVKVLDTVGSVLFSKILVAARITAPGVTTTTPATTTTAPVTTTPPTTTPGNSTKSISSPANNSVVVGTAVKLQINDASNVARVDWFLNGISIGSDVTPADPLTWNAQGWGSGPFTLKAVVVDRSWKQTTTGTVSFSIR